MYSLQFKPDVCSGDRNLGICSLKVPGNWMGSPKDGVGERREEDPGQALGSSNRRGICKGD